MKAVGITVLMIILGWELSAQEIKLPMNENGRVEYSFVASLDTTFTKSLLYSRTLEWVASFKSAKDVIQLNDKDAGTIVVKGIIPVEGGMYLADGKIDFTFKVQVKTGKFRYWVNDFVHSSYKEGFSGGALEMKNQIAERF